MSADDSDGSATEAADGYGPHANKVLRPAPMSALAAEFIGHFTDLDLETAPEVEPAMLAPFCAPGDFLNISGPAGCGKTSIAADILLAAVHPDRMGLALGGLFRFTQQPYGAIKCIILDAETSPDRWSSRLALKARQEGLDLSRICSVRHVQSRAIGLNRPGSRAERSRAIAEAFGRDERALVFIDTLAMAWAPTEMNDPEWVFGGLTPFREECRRFGTTVVALTHTKRPSTHAPNPVGPIGTSFQENQADVQLIVSRTKGGAPGIRLTHIKSRRSFWIQQESHLDLRFTPAYGYEPLGKWRELWPHEWPGGEPSDCTDDDNTALRMERLFGAANGASVTTRQVVESLNIPDRTARYHVRRLANAGIIERVGNGPSTAWRCRAR